MLEPASAGATPARYGWIRRVTAVGGRYGIATLGPLGVSAAHFLASLLLLRTLPAADFGLFAFLLVVMGFCFSVSSALIATPYTVAANQRDFSAKDARTFFIANLLFATAAALACGGIAFGLHAGTGTAALLFGLFGGFAMLRSFARAHAYAAHAPMRVAVVDIAYATLLLAGLAVTWLTHNLTLITALIAFAAAATAAVIASGASYLKLQFVDAFAGNLRAYASIWRNQSRWTLLGVSSTEGTFNAHAYMVTLIAGPAAFAPIAAAALFMRPVSMCANSLLQLERPAMARAIAEGKLDVALRSVRHFRWAIMLVWLGTVTALAVIYLTVPKLLLPAHYDFATVVMATALWACVEVVHSWVVPDSALLQAADRFRPLAAATVQSSMVTIVAALALLVAFGPVASLCGVVLGVIVLAQRMTALKRAWRLQP
jgi:O-antigen/teichoic acid export membrane protein